MTDTTTPIAVNPQTIAGTSRLRSYRVELFNPLAGELAAVFHQETLIELNDGTTISQPAPDLRLPFAPGQVIHVLDPTTGADTGQTMTMGQVYAGILSAYVAAATTAAALPPIGT